MVERDIAATSVMSRSFVQSGHSALFFNFFAGAVGVNLSQFLVSFVLALDETAVAPLDDGDSTRLCQD